MIKINFNLTFLPITNQYIDYNEIKKFLFENPKAAIPLFECDADNPRGEKKIGRKGCACGCGQYACLPWLPAAVSRCG